MHITNTDLCPHELRGQSVKENCGDLGTSRLWHSGHTFLTDVAWNKIQSKKILTGFCGPGSLVPKPHPPGEKKGLITIRHPARPSDIPVWHVEWPITSQSNKLRSVVPHGIDSIPYMAYLSMWSPTMVFGYTPLGSGGMSYCNKTPFLSARVGSGHTTSPWVNLHACMWSWSEFVVVHAAVKRRLSSDVFRPQKGLRSHLRALNFLKKFLGGMLPNPPSLILRIQV